MPEILPFDMYSDHGVIRETTANNSTILFLEDLKIYTEHYESKHIEGLVVLRCFNFYIITFF